MLIPTLLFAAAVACLVLTWLLLRSLGPRYRVGRLLSSTPSVSIDEARQLAGGPPTYVRATGRISSDEEFPDENDRPLVFRRKRIEIADRPGAWRVVADEREAVPFGIETRSAYVAVDGGAIDVGMVAIRREATGVLGDLPTDLQAELEDLPADTPARLVIEQLSAVEHATVCGVPVERDGSVMLTAGLGRPLIVTTLDMPDAMRLLAGPHRQRVVLAAATLATAVVLALLALVAAVAGL